MTAASKLAAAAAAAGAACAALFLAWPALDVAGARLFYVDGVGFPLSRVAAMQETSAVLRALAVGAGVALIAALAWRAVRGAARTPAWLPESRVAVYLLAVLIVAPGLVVNALFKENWGRARPAQTEAFGGDRAFSPPLVVSDQCESNCSFVSGDASVGFALTAVGLVAARRRRLWIAAGLAAGSVIGLGRIAVGAHYPSDILFAGVFVVAAAALLYRLVFGPGRRERRAPP